MSFSHTHEHVPTPADSDKKEFRCFHCGKLLAKGDLDNVDLEIKCHRCGIINSIFKTMNDQVVITDPNGVILYANSLVEKITGYKLTEILGKTPSLWGKQMPTEFYKELWHDIKVEKKSVVVKVRNKKKDGTLYSALLRISPVFDINGEISMFVGVESVLTN